MLDGLMRRALDPSLNTAGRALAHRGLHANHVTLIGLALGLVAATLIGFGASTLLALVPLAASRLADGLDGAVARASAITDFGGYLDIVCDFIFYGVIPLAFVLRDPSANGLAGAFLLTSFYANGASFLAFAVLRLKRKGLIQAKVTGYPLVPIVLLLFSIALTINTIWVQPQQSLLGLLFVASGVPVYYYFKKRKTS